MLPAGRYYVGDLCYVVEGDDWDRLLDITNFGDGEFKIDGVRFAIYGTMYGDGTYIDEQGRDYDVDSGTIGCIPISYTKGGISGGQEISFGSSFRTGVEDGEIFFGDVSIQTDL